MSILGGQLKKLPDTPGVYLFVQKTKDKRLKTKEILYIGKATSLRDRVRSYFNTDIEQARGPLIVKMLEEVTGVEVQKTDSVLEALILESQLIKKHQPRYNSKEKSDTSFYYVVITREDFPRVFTVRGRELTERYDPDTFRYTFGPFPHGTQLREALSIVRKIFPFRGEKDPVEKEKRGKSYLRRELGLVPDFEKVGKREYGRTIQHLRLFFEGKKQKLVKVLEREMKQYAREQQFEKAENVKRQIFALEHIRDVSLIKDEHSDIRKNIGMRIEAYDVAHTAGQERVGVMVVVEDSAPRKSAYRKFNIKTTKKGDTDALKEILERRFKHASPGDGLRPRDEWQLPQLIVVDGSTAQLNAAKAVLKAFGYEIPVVGVVKNARHRPQRITGAHKHIHTHERDILLANSEAHRFAIGFHRKKRGIR